MQKIIPYGNLPETGSIDWLNEVTGAYLQGDFVRAQVAAIMFHAESTEALRLLLLEGTADFGKVMAMSDQDIKELGN